MTRLQLQRSLIQCRAAAVLLALAVLACRGESAEEEVNAEVTVGTEVIAMRDFTEVISAIGEVVPRPGHVSAIGAPAPTRVTRVLTAPGARVATGDTLALLESTVFVSVERGARAAAEAARLNAERTRRLVESGILPRRDLEQATAALATADADLVVASRNVELGVIRAPFRGVVTKVGAVLGAAVDVGDVLVEVADPDAVDVVLAVPADEAARIRTGAAVVLQSDENASRDTIGRGTVAEVGGVVDAESRSVGIRVTVADARRPLRIGETLFAHVTVATIRDALVVPETALVPEGDGFKVFVVDSADVAHEQPVEVGARHAGFARILSGLAVGARVVTTGAFGISEGARVVAPKP